MELEPLLPEEGELVLATVKNITSHGAYVTLDEYGDMDGFLHISEIRTGWVRHIERYVGVGQKKILKVIRISKTRKEVDLSLRQVSGEERREKLIAIKRDEKANSTLQLVERKLDLDEKTSSMYKELLIGEFETLYDAVEQISKKGINILKKLDLPEDYSSTLEAIAKEKIIVPTVKIHGLMELRSNLPDGIEIIKSALLDVENLDAEDTKVKIRYLGAPRYRIDVEAENYKIAEKALQTSIEKVNATVEKKKGSFSFKRER
ncbi:MAG: translation initiation factor IF-2 subunit alpha [Candidatus Methylarchaceae archaeon HK02M2]|nr:translation initiation factor IF-2 subunit alpha [Candidatus Methylarchaceae archaeon HK02M2]